VKIGAFIDDCLDNLIYAISAGVGAGTLYSTGTTINTKVTASKVSGTEMLLTSIVYGTIGNAIPTTETMTDVLNAFDAVTLGTTTAGVDCTAANADGVIITAFTSNTVLDITAAQGAGTTVSFTATAAFSLDGSLGNGLASTSVLANGSFGTTTLLGGSDATANEASAALTTAYNTLTVNGITATDGTGSVAFAGDIAGTNDGSLGNLISTTTMVNASFATGTFIGGSDATANEAATALHTAITADILASVSSVDGTGNVVVTALEEGTAPNSWGTTTTAVNAAWGTPTLTTGSDASAVNAVTAIALAITTDASAVVTAVDSTGNTVLLTAKVKGVSGDLITLTETMSNATIDGAGFLGGTTAGVDGTVGYLGERYVSDDMTTEYIAMKANTIVDANWRKATFATL
jgi:hypothetical protein